MTRTEIDQTALRQLHLQRERRAAIDFRLTLAGTLLAGSAVALLLAGLFMATL